MTASSLFLGLNSKRRLFRGWLAIESKIFSGFLLSWIPQSKDFWLTEEYDRLVMLVESSSTSFFSALRNLGKRNFDSVRGGSFIDSSLGELKEEFCISFFSELLKIDELERINASVILDDLEIRFLPLPSNLLKFLIKSTSSYPFILVKILVQSIYTIISYQLW